MSDLTDAALRDLVTNLQQRLSELRQAGDPGVLLATANAAADAIEHRVGGSLNEVQRQALTAVRRFTFNIAADCWPGWSVSAESPDPRNLVAALELARRSLGLVRKLELGPVQEGTGTWLCGAFDLALGRRANAASAFADARELFVAAKAPGLALLAEGYVAIAQRVAAGGGEDLEQVCGKIAAGGFEDGAEWIEQLRTALNVFGR